ncbi:MAG: NifB/NifX family molybdenum-iron cluster-binding protein [Peptostreptococcaceae bacterium]|nr:NifB/NifX family molybdenum-iron cluster-binding protein [Peptostreptococcaceae bacterium]
MIIGICAKEQRLDSPVADRFGRAECYVMYNTETKEVTTTDNSAKNEASGAGGSAVRILNEHGVEVVLAPELGPKAMDAIKAFEIKAYSYGNSKTVKEALDNYESGKLKQFITNSTASHHGLRKA